MKYKSEYEGYVDSDEKAKLLSKKFYGKVKSDINATEP